MADPMYNSGGVVFFLCLAAILAVAGVGCAVGGAGGLHSDCNDSGLFERAEGSCADTFRPVWWAIHFEGVVLIATYILVLCGMLGQMRIVLVAFIAMASIDVMDELEKVLQLKDQAFYKTIESREEEIDVTMAGLILLGMVNFILVVVLGVTAASAPAPPPPKKEVPRPPAPPPQQQQQPVQGTLV